MAQTQKDDVRQRFVSAAIASFAERGFEATTMADVATRARSSIGNLYKYFPNKDDLFAAALPDDFAEELRRRTRKRIKALGTVRDTRKLSPESRYHVVAAELLDFCLANRERVVVLLARAHGTPLESFADDFVDRLVGWALDYAREAYPRLVVTASLRFALRRIYTGFVQSLAEALESFRSETHVREVVAHLTTHHQGGLLHLFESVKERDS